MPLTPFSPLPTPEEPRKNFREKRDSCTIQLRQVWALDWNLRVGDEIIHHQKKKKKSAWGITVYWALSLPFLFLVFTPILGSTGRGVFFFSVSLMRNLRVREETRLSQDDSPCKGSRRWEPQLLVPILCLFHLAHHSANHAVISWEHRSWTSRCSEMESTGLPPREHLTVSLGIGMSKSVITIKSLII